MATTWVIQSLEVVGTAAAPPRRTDPAANLHLHFLSSDVNARQTCSSPISFSSSLPPGTPSAIQTQARLPLNNAVPRIPRGDRATCENYYCEEFCPTGSQRGSVTTTCAHIVF